MIFEHEIPDGCRLYFGDIAKKKRNLENKVSDFFDNCGFMEIITPNFSYSGHQSIEDVTKLIKLNDTDNNQLTLRADSTLDVARIITKRLGRTTDHKKWFYIQPIFSYPSIENYQIGCEWLEHTEISDVINLTSEIFDMLAINPLIQIANLNIPKIIEKEFDIPISYFKDGEIAKLFALKLDWLDGLIHVSSKEDLEKLYHLLPHCLKHEAMKLIRIVGKLSYKNITISPLYFDSMKYYDDIYFRAIEENDTIAKGGQYNSDGVESLGFALCTDNLLKILED
ncbi:MAG: ATP phosphoribosyltransferase regulatory subunit [Arcobacter sp.]|nr:ATP phosphoribosyltransferase regulatory subunit [Arcobacter sp.]